MGHTVELKCPSGPMYGSSFLFMSAVCAKSPDRLAAWPFSTRSPDHETVCGLSPAVRPAKTVPAASGPLGLHTTPISHGDRLLQDFNYFAYIVTKQVDVKPGAKFATRWLPKCGAATT